MGGSRSPSVIADSETLEGANCKSTGALVEQSDGDSSEQSSSKFDKGDYMDDYSSHYSGHTNSSYLYTAPYIPGYTYQNIIKFEEFSPNCAGTALKTEDLDAILNKSENSKQRLFEKVKCVQKACVELLREEERLSEDGGEFKEALNKDESSRNMNVLKVSPGKLPNDGKYKNVQVRAEFKDANSNLKRKVDFELGSPHSKSSTGEKHARENQAEDVLHMEDIIAKQLPSLHGIQSDSREECQRAEMCRRIVERNRLLKIRAGNIDEEKQRLSRYTPGDWLIETGGMNRYNYDIPNVTSLLLVGPKGAGKSTLINNILRVLSNENRVLNRAQVSYKSSPECGSYFLQEYSVPGGSNFCIFDSRGISGNVTEDLPLLEGWMTNGIHHGEMVLRSSDDITIRVALEHKGRDRHFQVSKIRKVHFVIFVVNALSILQQMASMDTLSSDMLLKLFCCPYLSFKDDKPLVVMTHGDMLSVYDRLKVRIFLGELLGVSAVDQVFDISDECNRATDIELLDMLECALQRADRNLPYKEKNLVHGLKIVFKNAQIF
eukprot:Gb_09837 [translate_table: standard]